MAKVQWSSSWTFWLLLQKYGQISAQNGTESFVTSSTSQAKDKKIDQIQGASVLKTRQ
jgi:hypothetical protein